MGPRELSGLRHRLLKPVILDWAFFGVISFIEIRYPSQRSSVMVSDMSHHDDEGPPEWSQCTFCRGREMTDFMTVILAPESDRGDALMCRKCVKKNDAEVLAELKKEGPGQPSR